ncbi:4Fe-4S binding protein [Chloroflexota bacterium]
MCWPSLNLKAEAENCINCHACDRNCPMSLEVNEAVHSGSMDNTECIMCGSCVDNCPSEVIRYTWRRP